jgi:hypothetical protein
MKSRIGFLLFTGALLFLSFVAGAASYHYRIGPGLWVRMALGGRQALEQKAKEVHYARPQLPVRIEDGTVAQHFAGEAFSGLTLITLEMPSAAFLIDMSGRVRHRWALPFSKAWPKAPHIRQAMPDAAIFWRDAVLLPNGDLIVCYTALGDTPYGYGLAKIDKNSNLIWAYNGHTHHDFSLDEDGNIYIVTHDISLDPIPGFAELTPPILEDFIIKLSTDGKELAKVSVLEAFRNSPYKSMIRKDGLRKGDYLHTNTAHVLKKEIAYPLPNVKPGQVLISLRSQDLLAIVDMEARSAVWAERGPWHMQHHPEFLPNGNIMLFDNQGANVGNKHLIPRSRVIEYDLRAKNIVWRYNGDPRFLLTKERGMQQVLPNNNILITESEKGRIVEVNREGKIIWEYWSPRAKGGKEQTIFPQVLIGQRYSAETLSFLDEP